MNYYDIVLALIPLAFVAIVGSLTVFGVGVTTAVPSAGVVSAGVVGHAMFVRAPVAAGRDLAAGTEQVEVTA